MFGNRTLLLNKYMLIIYPELFIDHNISISVIFLKNTSISYFFVKREVISFVKIILTSENNLSLSTNEHGNLF